MILNVRASKDTNLIPTPDAHVSLLLRKTTTIKTAATTRTTTTTYSNNNMNSI
jgi:hypothetical protein